MAKYDGGAYADIILKGDIHTANQQAAGIPTRDIAKRFIYGYLYGAGNTKLGSLVAPQAEEAEQEAIGKNLRTKFLKNIPALRALIEAVQAKTSASGYLIGLDGRLLHSRSQHSALNLLLQSAGALVMKQATILLWKHLKEDMGYTFGVEVAQMAHIHDEYQLAVRNDIPAETVGEIAVQAIREAGEHFRFRCPLDGEYKTGKNWAETH
jgi:DNA polymerase I-like protein with 3'-5' exonuclease and polymerase domains